MFNSPYKVINHRKFNTWCKYQKRIDTYGCGCQHNCSYCYAKCLLDFRKNWDYKNPRVAYISEIIEEINLLSRKDIVRLGSMTDCFQPIEKTQKVTYQTIKALNEHKINYLIVTKSDLVATDEYVSIYDKKLAHFQITISATSDEKCLEYENAPRVSSRIKAIEKLYECGFDVSVRLSPFMHQWVDLNILNSIKCDKILIEFLKVNHWIKKWFKIDYSEYTLKYGGYENLQLDKKIELTGKINGFEQKSVGEYVKNHYEYFMENFNYNKNDCCNLDIKQTGHFFEPEQMELQL